MCVREGVRNECMRAKVCMNDVCGQTQLSNRIKPFDWIERNLVVVVRVLEQRTRKRHRSILSSTLVVAAVALLPRLTTRRRHPRLQSTSRGINRGLHI